MPDFQGETPISLRVQLSSTVEEAFLALSSGPGRARFWADSAEEQDGQVHFRFSNGMSLESHILACEAPHHFSLSYFGGSRVDFHLEPDGSGGSLLTVVESGVPQAGYADQRAGWVTVLLTLKAALDFGVDLRNPDPAHNWENGFVDV